MEEIKVVFATNLPGNQHKGHIFFMGYTYRSGAPTEVQYSTIKYCTVQHSTVQHSTVQYSTVQNIVSQIGAEVEDLLTDEEMDFSDYFESTYIGRVRYIVSISLSLKSVLVTSLSLRSIVVTSLSLRSIVVTSLSLRSVLVT